MGFEISQLNQSISRNDVITVNASVIVISPSQNRSMYALRNISTGGQVISLSFSDTDVAVANQGIVLNVNDIFSDSDNAAYKCWRGRITAIASGAGGKLSVVEVPIQQVI